MRTRSVVGLVLVASVLLGCKQAQVVKVVGQRTPTSGSVVVRSLPPGMAVYAVPRSVAASEIGEIKLNDKQYRVGTTPIEINLEPGDYEINVAPPAAMKDPPLPDGQEDNIFVLDGAELSFKSRIYGTTIVTGHQQLVTSLLRTGEEPLSAYVKSLPGGDLFPRGDETAATRIFADHQVPQQDWPDLLAMLRKTGKAVWPAAKGSPPLVVTYGELQPTLTLVVASEPKAPAAP